MAFNLQSVPTKFLVTKIVYGTVIPLDLINDELSQFKGIGQAKAISIVAAMELGKRKQSEEPQALKTISSSKVVFQIMQPLLGELPHEEFWILYLNHSNKVLKKEQISKGGITGTVVDARLIYKTALEIYATGLVLCHNHPSGRLVPSDADRQITRKLKLAGEHLEILVIDHLIITEKGYYSFADEGIL